MSATLIQNAVPGEALIGIEPALLEEQPNLGWLHRLSLFTGRTLTAVALQSEQSYRAGRLAVLGQCVTQGVVKGLELVMDLNPSSSTYQSIQVMPGYGISATGEDVALQRTLQATLGQLQVIDPQAGSVIDTFANYSKNSSNKTYAGVLLLQPVTVQMSGADVDTGPAPFIVSGNLNASCDQDPEEYAFEDWQIVDGVRLVMVAWPAALTLPATTSGPIWRNSLVYTVFNAEMGLSSGARMPWEMLGVPIGLVGFDSTWTPQFLDRSAVVRTGGLLRSRYLAPAQPKDPSTLSLIQPAFAQARVLQLAEQLADTPALTNFLQSFALLPPCGVLPASAMDFKNQVVLWFPPTWIPTVTPVYQEEVESALLAGMTAQPLDVTQPEAVDVLVPLPDAVFDPNVLVTETVAPAFTEAVDSATDELQGVLLHRCAIQQEANALEQGLNGAQSQPLYNLDAGLTPAEIALRGQVVVTLAPGNHTITAAYSGDAKNAATKSGSLVQSVVASVGAVALGSSLNPSVAGQQVTFTAILTPSSATGTVQFNSNGAAMGAPVSLIGGIATYSAQLAAGSYVITAAYSGDKNNPPSTSQPLTQTVGAAPAGTTPAPALTLALNSSLNPSAFGQPVTVTATLSSPSATGTIQFQDNGTALGPALTVTGGQVTLQVYVPAGNETFGTTASNGSYISQDYQNLVTTANASPYVGSDGNSIFTAADLTNLQQSGIQPFINSVNAKLAQANDLLDLAFLTLQADIYRLRNFVLGASDATALAVSPIVAQIATGESASVTAANLQSYLSQALASNAPLQPNPTTTPPPATTTFPIAKIPPIRLPVQIGTIPPARIAAQPLMMRQAMLVSAATPTPTTTPSPIARAALLTASRVNLQAVSATTAEAPSSAAQQASPTGVVGQSPIPGAQLNLRTLTIAERMQNPPSQDALFYATGNRVAITQMVANLNIYVNDLPIVLDQSPTPPSTTTAPPTTTTPPPQPVASVNDFINNNANVISVMLNPTITVAPSGNPDEAALFTTSIRVLEQHSQLLRSLEARVALYNSFLGLCSTAIGNIQADLPPAQTLVAQLANDLAQARQDVAFTTALLNDEETRVANVNSQRSYILQNYVQAVVYARPRTQQPDSDVPSRQLVPGNIASPVPTCLSQTSAIPPELSGMVGLLREAPISWLPPIQKLLDQLVSNDVAQQLAAEAQARAALQLDLAIQGFAAAFGDSGLYEEVINNIYTENQVMVRALQTQRAATQLSQMSNQSLQSNLQLLESFAAAGDLLSSSAVQMEIVNPTARLLQQISRVATCLYARACQALPIDRLAWAEFLRGTGLSIQMQSLAVLPNWNTQDYVTRQQTQMLVDWLFQQIDITIPNAVAFISDVVRVAILMAANAPLNQVIGGAVTLATTPVRGGIVSLTLPSTRVVRGTYVQLYSAGVLTAQAVVTDLDSTSVRATVTDVYQTGVGLQPNDVAHFTAQAPQAAALRAFDMGSR